MSFTDTNIWSATKKLYRYKLKAQIGIFLSLMFIQCLGLLISFGFSKYYSTKDPEVLISIKYYSGDAIFVFTLIGAFMAGMMVNPKSHRDTDFFFVANRLTSHLSNIAFLLTVSLYAGITVPLLGSVFKLIIYLTADHSLILSGDVRVICRRVCHWDVGDDHVGLFIIGHRLSMEYIYSTRQSIHYRAAGIFHRPPLNGSLSSIGIDIYYVPILCRGNLAPRI